MLQNMVVNLEKQLCVEDLSRNFSRSKLLLEPKMLIFLHLLTALCAPLYRRISMIFLKNMSFTHIHKSVIFQLSISEIHFCVKGFFYSSYTFAAEK